ncbi:MAG: guanylate kinase, partial [Muribaculaceae bacterium]|nr:guanylate kinase [Muribaculaceae bacterium]
YFFASEKVIKDMFERGVLVLVSEVYAGTCYGTLESEVERVTRGGSNLIMDVDVKGALNIKERYGAEAISIFVMPPTIDVLEKRLRGRATDSEETIARRLAKAEFEMGFAPRFDTVVINDDLDTAVSEVDKKIRDFIIEE